MTLKQLKTIEELPKNNFNLRQSMLKAGYTEQGSRAGNNYQRLRKITSKLDFLDPDRIKADIDKTYKQAELIPELKDRVNAKSRIEEHRAKLAGMVTDKVEQKGEVQKVIVVYNKP